jgi:hypothetical protein
MTDAERAALEEAAKDTLIEAGTDLHDFWYHPTTQGTIHVVSGTLECAAGLTATGGSGGLAAVGGAALCAHGMDEIATGFETLRTGQTQETRTHRLLRSAGEGAGLDPQTSSTVATWTEATATAAVSTGVLRSSLLGSAPPGTPGPGVPRATGLADDLVDASTPVGRRGNPLNVAVPEGRTALNSPTTINGRQFSGHAIDRLQGQGIPPSVVEGAIRPGNAIPGKVAGTTAYYDSANNITVVTDTASGRVVTVDFGRIRQ